MTKANSGDSDLQGQLQQLTRTQLYSVWLQGKPPARSMDIFLSRSLLGQMGEMQVPLCLSY